MHLPLLANILLLPLLTLAANTADFTAIQTALGGKPPRAGEKHAFVAAHKLHHRLIIADISGDSGTQDARCRMYELTLDAQPFSVDKCWFMNHGKPIALSAKDKWACSEIAGTFTPVGPVKSGVTHDAILTLGEQLVKDQPKYLALKNNCKTFAMALYEKIKGSISQRRAVQDLLEEIRVLRRDFESAKAARFVGRGL